MHEDLKITQELFSSEILNLRQNVLHPKGPVERVSYSPDTDPLAIHILIRKNNELIAVGSLLPEDEELKKSLEVWRIRGMAVRADMRGKGLGGIVLDEMFKGLEKTQLPTNPSLIWCNARIIALNLYTRSGFKVLDGEFDIPGSGPHRRLHKTLPL